MWSPSIFADLDAAGEGDVWHTHEKDHLTSNSFSSLPPPEIAKSPQDALTQILGVAADAALVETKLQSLWSMMDGDAAPSENPTVASAAAPPLGMTKQAYEDLKHCCATNASFGSRGALGSQFSRWLGGSETTGQ